MIAKHLVEALAMMGLQGTVLAIVALAICRGRMRPAWQAAVWLVVLVKFVLPWGPAMPWSLSDLFASAQGRDAIVVVGAPGTPAPAAHASPMWIALAVAWASLTALLLTRALLRYRRALASARRGQPAPADMVAELATLAARVGVRTPALVIGDAHGGPHVVGILRPTIVVPPALTGTLLRAALLHELAHVRRRDALGRLVQVFASSVFFFWPVIRLVNRRLDLAREAACDAWALEAGDLPRPAYARLLVDMARLHVSDGLALGAHHLDARVAAVLDAPVRARMGLGHKALVGAWALIALGGARTAHAHTDSSCVYSAKLAAALYTAHPEADRDGDGVLSRDEACEYQAELLSHYDMVPADDASVSLLAEPLICDSDVGVLPVEASCHQGD